MYKSKGLKNVSIQKVKDYFLKNKSATKHKIASETQLSLATVTNILKDLQEQHFINRIEDCESTGGRKAKQYMICSSYMLFGLIDLRVHQQKICLEYRVVDLDCVMKHNEIYRYDLLCIKDIVDVIEFMKRKSSIGYVGISFPGIVSHGHIEKSDIEGFENTDLQGQLEELCQIPIVIENDVNTGMLGYIHRHVVESPSVAFVYQPDNHHSGCGLYINHEILYGATHFAGELAYLPQGSLEQQLDLLSQEPELLLMKQLMSIIAIMNPSLIILYTPLLHSQDFIDDISQYIPQRHLPEFQFINHMETYVFEGLASLCIKQSRYQESKEDLL